MAFQACIIKEKKVIFAIACVKQSAIECGIEREKVMALLRPYFPDIPIILRAKMPSGRHRYLGRPDIVKFLSRIRPDHIPWKIYTIQDKS